MWKHSTADVAAREKSKPDTSETREASETEKVHVRDQWEEK